MFKLGDYEELEAREISAYLKKAGMKVDLKPTIEAQVQNDEFLEGRFSEIKGMIKDKAYIEEIERYLDALRKTLQEKPSAENFGGIFIRTLIPSLDEDLDALKKEIGSEEQEAKEAGPEDISEDNAEKPSLEAGDGSDSKEGAQPSQDEAEKMRTSFSHLTDIIIESEKAKDFALSVLSLNDITVGDVVEGTLDDPVVAVPVDLDEYGPDHPNAKSVLSVYLSKNYELYVDEFSTFLAEGLDEKFQEEHMEESLKIRSMDLLLGELIEHHSSEKMEFGDFKEECFFSTESDDSAYRVFGDEVAEDIAKVLEKNGLLKMKGDVIKWKK
jgi:hypothetical protein